MEAVKAVPIKLVPSGFGETRRQDWWWIEPIVVFVVFASFIVYATWAAFQNAHYEYGPVPPEVLRRARELAATCAEYGVELPTAALRFPLREPAVRAVVIGAVDPSHVRKNLDRLRTQVPAELWQRLAAEGLARE